jgi:hypothetical protein
VVCHMCDRETVKVWVMDEVEVTTPHFLARCL